jgi:hypothetical protein
MAQALNLDHPALHRVPVDFALRHALLAMAAVLALVHGGAVWLRQGTLQAQAQAAELQAVAAARPLAMGLATTGTPAQAELDQLRRLADGQHRVRQALAHGVLGNGAEGYTSYFTALARQAQPNLWITGLALGHDAQDLTLEGRMLDTHSLAPWLRRLADEPRFKGRSFAQLQLRRATEAGVSVTEFSLRSVPAAP